MQQISIFAKKQGIKASLLCMHIKWPFKVKITKKPRYVKVKVEHYLLSMFSPPKISWVVSGIKYICLHLLPVFYLIQPSSKQINCFDFRKQNCVLPIVFYVPWKKTNKHKKVVWRNFQLNNKKISKWILHPILFLDVRQLKLIDGLFREVN